MKRVGVQGLMHMTAQEEGSAIFGTNAPVWSLPIISAGAEGIDQHRLFERGGTLATK